MQTLGDCAEEHSKRSSFGYSTQMSNVPTEDIHATKLWENEVQKLKVSSLQVAINTACRYGTGEQDCQTFTTTISTMSVARYLLRNTKHSCA